MSLIDSIFGTAAAPKPSANDTVSDDDRTVHRKGGQDDDGNPSNLHSLFHTVIPMPDRKLEYNKSKKDKNQATQKRGTATTSWLEGVHGNKRHKNTDGVEQNVDHHEEDESGNVGNSTGQSLPQQHHSSSNSIGNSDDTDKNERTVFVGNIPITYSRKHLRQLFIDCGSIQSTRIRGIAIPNDDAETKNKEIEEMNGKKKSVIKLPPSLAGQQQIYKKVCINTNTGSSTMGMDSNKKQSNIGYVVFHHKDSVEKALLKNNMMVTVGPVPASSLFATSTTTTSHGNLNNVRHIRVDRCATTTTKATNNTAPDDNNSNHNHTLRDPKRTIFIGNLPYHTDEETLHQHILQHMKLETSENNIQKNIIIESIRIVRNPTTYLCQGFAYVLFTSIQYVPTALQMLHQTTYMKQTLRIQTCKAKTKNEQVGKQNSTNRNSTNVTTISTRSHSKPTTNAPRPSTATTIRTATTKAVGALKRVLQKQQRLLSQDSKKTKPIRKRGPTTSKTKITKKPAASSRKKQK